MIRSLAALFAKKTAIVAITGVTVIGGATLALAVEGDPPTDDPAAALLEPCEGGVDRDEDGSCPEDEPKPIEPCDDGTTPAEGEACPEDEPKPAEPCDDGTTPAEGEACPEDDEGAENDELVDDETDDDVVAEHPENHGKYVSEAAKGGGECAGLSGRDKGQCVAGVAKSDIGKKTAEEPAAETTEKTVTEQSAPVQEPAAAAVTEEQPKGKPAHAGPPAGKGKGGKG
ncbi:MAG TPA: hypothetical protein VLR27_17915 [Acidimicrobiales bacterium]|nr:hypothetical protein [Acidimicrobiales bacterium]